MQKFNPHDFCRTNLKLFRDALRKMNIDIPKLCQLGNYVTIAGKVYEIDEDDGCSYSIKHNAIIKYLEDKEPKKYAKWEANTIKEFDKETRVWK